MNAVTNTPTYYNVVEQLIEYVQAARMPALQCFIFDLEKSMKLAHRYLVRCKMFSYLLKKKHFRAECSRLRDFIILFNKSEYKRMNETVDLVSHTMYRLK